MAIHTITSKFILPLIGLNYRNERLKTFKTSYLVTNPNGYFIAIALYNMYGAFSCDEERLKKLNYVCDITQGSTTIFLFDEPEEYSKDIRLIIDGKYSKISEKAKLSIINAYDNNLSGKLCDILYKKENAYLALERALDVKIERGAEVYDIPNKDKEIFSYEQLQKELIEYEIS